MLKPCQEEEWFIEDTLEELGKTCSVCRKAVENNLLLHGNNVHEALSNIYILSRALRVKAALSGRPYRHIGHWALLHVFGGVHFLSQLKPWKHDDQKSTVSGQEKAGHGST